ncbi:ATP-dependent DNA ligase [Rhodococcus sp. Leaf7]|uniref:DNA polymerase domain-containing protein n=1 Tax=unclassified Rhodococcus (in: high G+C Gram-positive bacteria) TaxID=192944 RepID=UPI0007010E9F|nr:MULTISPECIES: DNA polymerase domain-containing protein [unclassified Rhodococcus (in: high G+C Gram-positive bacteria)]KQU04420.1 ATP-dependent DNA ligase [Rhodococcus sp. Leaf7]KQU40605.1 ATP-dependent DNA ligase [Rhodococcus sp. Leaf247]
MAKSAAAMVQVGEREVRVSSPDRIIYEATARTPDITKLQVCEYFASVGEPIVRALGDRPTAMERWPDGYRDGMRLATGPQDKGGDGFYQKRLPRGAPDYIETVEITFPSKRRAEELCPSEPAALVWAAQMGTLTFHPWPVRRPDVDHPDELRIDIDPQPGTTFTDARRVALLTRDVLQELGIRSFVKTSGNRGVHVYVRIRPEWGFEDVRHAAIGLGRELERRDDSVTTAWWKEQRGSRLFIDYNQNNRDRTIAGAWSLRARPGAPVSTPLTWDQLADTDDPAVYNIVTVADHLRDGGDPWADMDDEAFSLEPLLDLWNTLPGGELNFPPDYPKMPGEPPRVQPSKKVAAHWDEDGNKAEQ